MPTIADAVRAEFDAIHAFDFSRCATPIAYDHVGIQPPRDPRVYANQYIAVNELGFLTSGKDYNSFLRKDLTEAMSWPDERVTEDGEIVTGPAPTGAMNRTKDAAISWFNELTARIADESAPDAVLVFGDPGTGKSTLFKFLINHTRNAARARGVFYSRFEASKYLRWHRAWLNRGRHGLPPAEPSAIELAEAMIHYIYACILRDYIVTFEVENPSARPLRFRADGQWFRSPQQIDSLLTSAPGMHGAISRDAEAKTSNVLQNLGSLADLKPERLAEIPSEALIPIVRFIMRDLRASIVFDGLDYLQPGDNHFERGKYRLLDILVKELHPTPDDVQFRKDMGFLGPNIILMRHLTYEYWLEKIEDEGNSPGDALQLRIESFAVAPPSSEVILLRLLPPEVKHDGVAIERPEIYSLMRKLIASVSDAIYPQRPALQEGDLIGIFNGNLRDELIFINRVLVWLAHGIFAPSRSSVSFGEFVAHMKAGRIEAEIGRRAYRLIEFLLLWNAPAFQNLVRVDARRMTPIPGKTWEPQMTRNSKFTGLVDNIFNYSAARDGEPECENHCLLMKVRILQYLAQRTTGALYRSRDPAADDAPWIEQTEIEAFLRTLGYSPGSIQHVPEALAILRFGGFLFERRRHNKDWRQVQLSQKGRFAVRALLYNPAYIEHCFHQTLLPQHLLPLEPAQARGENVEAWSANSIKNCFVLANYIRYIEANTKEDLLRPYALHRQIIQQITLSVDHVCRNADGQRIAATALESMERVKADWKRMGLLP